MYARIYLEGGEQRDPEVDFPFLEFRKCRIVLKYWNMSDFPLLKNQHTACTSTHVHVKYTSPSLPIEAATLIIPVTLYSQFGPSCRGLNWGSPFGGSLRLRQVGQHVQLVEGQV